MKPPSRGEALRRSRDWRRGPLTAVACYAVSRRAKAVPDDLAIVVLMQPTGGLPVTPRRGGDDRGRGAAFAAADAAALVGGGEHMAESTAGNAVCSMAESATGTTVGSRGREAHHAARCISAWSP